MPDNVSPLPDPDALAARRGQPGVDERLERVAGQLSRLANELPHAMGWMEAEVEALRSEVRQSLKAIAERSAADRSALLREVALLRETVDAMSDALMALRDEVLAVTAPPGAPPAVGPSSRSGPTTGSGLGLPPRRPR